MSDNESPRLVECIKLKKTLPGLKKPPFPTAFGEQIYENVSEEAWKLWLTESVRIINTYRLDLSSREGTEFMLKQMKVWFGFEEGEIAATAWTPPKDD